MNTPSANDLLAARMAGMSDADHLVELDRLSRHLENELRKTRVERDLAIAHDSQPYPTAAAYEAVCATLERKKREINGLRTVLREIGQHVVKKQSPLATLIHALVEETGEL